MLNVAMVVIAIQFNVTITDVALLSGYNTLVVGSTGYQTPFPGRGKKLKVFTARFIVHFRENMGNDLFFFGLL